MSCTLPLKENADVVSLAVLVDGSELPKTMAIQGVEVVNQANRIPYARLRVVDGDPADGDFPESSGSLFIPGNEIDIQGGYHGKTQSVFTGAVLRQRVVMRNNSSWLEVECRAAPFKMALSRRNRYFEDKTDSAIAEALLNEYGLTPKITATSVTHPQLLQYQATDWDFMVSRLEANGQICIVDGQEVSSTKPSLSGSPAAELIYGANMLELDAEFDARSQSGGIRAMAWDAANQQLQEATAADPSWQGNGNLTADDLSSTTDRQEDLLCHGGSIASDALQAWADGAFLRARLAASRGHVRFQGLSEIRPGVVVQLSRVSDRFNGNVFVTGVRHEFSKNNWITDAEFGFPRELHAEQFPLNHLAAAGLAPAVSGLQVGVVTQLEDDPAGEHRIRVKVPLAGMDEQGVWARVATLDAGADRGMFFRPEVDDEVVLGFFHDDPAQPVVLGMLHSSAKAPPLEATKENHQKTYKSRSGISLLFDDDKKIVTLETPSGNSLKLTEEDKSILLVDQNGNKLTMNEDGIQIEDKSSNKLTMDKDGILFADKNSNKLTMSKDGISLEDQSSNKLALDKSGIALTSAKELALKAQTDLKGEGLNTEMKATAGFKASGSATAEISSSGICTVKGSLVQIN